MTEERGFHWTPIVLGVIGLASVAVQGYVAISIAEATAAARQTSNSVEEIHTAVNSDREKLMVEMKRLNALVISLSERVATLKAHEENK